MPSILPRLSLPVSLSLSLSVLPALASPADVTYAARVDRKNEIYVDVENGTRTAIHVTSVVVAFYDQRRSLIERNTIDCRTECSVGRDDVESFGPLEGPPGWDTVKVMNVFYEEGGVEAEPAEPKPTPSSEAKPSPPRSSLPASVPAPAIVFDGRTESLDGYAEWRRNGLLIVDGQRVRLGPSGKVKASKDIKTLADIPLGFEVKVKGHRVQGGVLEADEVQARENGTALFEQDLRSAFDAMEQKYLADRRMYEEDDKGKRQDYGRLYTSGPEVERVRRILKRLVPGYLEQRDFRVYVVENKEWNAMAAPNDSIYVFTGLLKDMDDDEVAIVLGHELTHATHEHSRKSFKKAMLIQLAALGVVVVTEEAVKDKNTRAVLQVATVLGASAWTSGYGRSHEDQADRVGLRYAAEGGFDVSKGPQLWNRFAQKYGNSPRVLNFFFGDHSVAEDRARNLTREIALNYVPAAGLR
jgi:Zn-dependent protease with chaperone function